MYVRAERAEAAQRSHPACLSLASLAILTKGVVMCDCRVRRRMTATTRTTTHTHTGTLMTRTTQKTGWVLVGIGC